MVEVSTSILNVEENDILSAIYNLEVAHTDYFHIDIMDGKFVSNNTIQKMKSYTQHIKQISNLPLDVHFMVEDVEEQIEEYIPFRPNIMTFHIEASKSKEETMKWIKRIQESGSKVGISLKPDTKLENIYEFLPYIHMVLVMTVEPGKGGQGIIPSTIEKVRQLKEYITKNKIDMDIEVDGGINGETANLVKEAGANILVAGTYIVKANNYKEPIEKIKE